MTGGIEFSMGFGADDAARTETGEGYGIYILANFSGRPTLPWRQRRFHKIDAGSFDATMSQLSPGVSLGAGAVLEFNTLEDFHPDAWIGKIKLLVDLLSLKRDLSHPDTAERAAARIRAFFPSQAEATNPAGEAGESQEDLLERLLGRKPEQPISSANALDEWLRSLVAPHAVKATQPEHLVMIGAIDRTVAQLVLTLLHGPDFQNLEAVWLALNALVNEEGADNHGIYLLDLGQAELASIANSEPEEFTRKLLDHARRSYGDREVLLIGDFVFSASQEDKALLAFCNRLASDCGAYFLAAAGPGMIETLVSANPEAWKVYRREIGGDRTILAFPKVLMRRPYGARRDPLQTLPIEECPEVPHPAELLWGNPAFLTARRIIRDIRGNGGDTGFFGDTPAFSYVDGQGETLLQAAAETVLNEMQAKFLLEQAVMPLVCFRQRPGVRLLGAAPLANI